MKTLLLRSHLSAWSSLVHAFGHLESRPLIGFPRLTPGTADCVSVGELIVTGTQAGGEPARRRRPALIWHVVEVAGGRLEWRAVEEESLQMRSLLIGPDGVAA